MLLLASWPISMNLAIILILPASILYILTQVANLVLAHDQGTPSPLVPLSFTMHIIENFFIFAL